MTPNNNLTLYANYGEASRAPTVIELGCFDPENPCGLPSDFASDPDLKQVVARTFEAGARGNLADKSLTWSLDAFHTLNSNDIQFTATMTSQVFFDNVGSTRRQGSDIALGGKKGAVSWRAVYSFVDAAHQSSVAVNGESNSSADANGNIQVQPGDRIPVISQHTARLSLDYAVSSQWDVGANLIVSAGAFLHGDENNANQAGGTNGEGTLVVGSGKIGGYSVLNMHSSYQVAKFMDVFVRALNLLDHKYATAGFLTSNSFDPNGTFRADPDHWTNENALSAAQP